MGITSFTLLGVNKESLGRLGVRANPPPTVESDYHDPTLSVKPSGNCPGSHANPRPPPRHVLRLRRRDHQLLAHQNPVGVGQIVGPQDRRFGDREAFGDR